MPTSRACRRTAGRRWRPCARFAGLGLGKGSSSRTTCYCDAGLPYDCFVMKLNHCGTAEPAEIPGAVGVKSCGCQNNCAE